MKTMVKTLRVLVWLCTISTICSFMLQDKKPALFIIGDSTVRNANREQWGWGSLIAEHFDTSRILLSNQAMAGRSSRSFTNEGRWHPG